MIISDMEEDYMVDVVIQTIGGGLKKMRNSAGLSQSQLAEASGVSLRTIQAYECGSKNINAAKLVNLLKLCNAMGCELSAIVTDEETLEQLEIYIEKFC